MSWISRRSPSRFTIRHGHEGAAYSSLRERVERADVILLGTPDYHGGISGATKNFLDHFWREFAGKLFATIVASHEKGLTVTDQLRTVARQCYAWTLPYGVSFAEDQDVKSGKITSNALKQRLEMLTRTRGFMGNSWPANAARICAGLNRATWRVTDDITSTIMAFQKPIEASRGFRLI